MRKLWLFACIRSFWPIRKLPKECTGDDIWHDRFQDIRNIERYLHRNGTLILKFFLNVSKKEQQHRFLE